MLKKNTVSKTKYIFVTGGVLSGVGKGTITSSIGKFLKEQGFNVNIIKIDPYLNVDAGTMRPTEHGEVFVTHDGGETDQDLGNYERFLNTEFSKMNSITSGQVYLSVIKRERNLDYEGACVQVVPHIPEEVKRRIRKSSDIHNADFTLIEVGGTTGDYENVLFLEALREMKLEGEKVQFVHVVYLPVPNNIGEMKTKPAQHSVRELNSIGIQPNFVICRSKHAVDEVRRSKLANYCNLSPEYVISAPDLASVYDVPIHLEEQGMAKLLLENMGYGYKKDGLKDWKKFSKKVKNLENKIKIGIVGKYFATGDFVLSDSYVSVIEAIKHACYASDALPDIEWINAEEYEKNPKSIKNLKNYDGIIVPGGFGKSGVEGKILTVEFCRENKIPYLGICYGLQMAVIEFARNVCDLKDANTTEVNPKTKAPVIDILPEQRELLDKKKYGASMRLGNYTANLTSGSKVSILYNNKIAVERHRHRYEVNPEFHSTLEENGLIISGMSPDRTLVEYIEIKDHPFFCATQAHPEFTSSPQRPNPMFLGLIKAAKK